MGDELIMVVKSATKKRLMDIGVDEQSAHRLADNRKWDDVKELSVSEIADIIERDGSFSGNLAPSTYYIIHPDERPTPYHIEGYPMIYIEFDAQINSIGPIEVGGEDGINWVGDQVTFTIWVTPWQRWDGEGGLTGWEDNIAPQIAQAIYDANADPLALASIAYIKKGTIQLSDVHDHLYNDPITGEQRRIPLVQVWEDDSPSGEEYEYLWPTPSEFIADINQELAKKTQFFIINWNQRLPVIT